eukprot:gene45671-61854_t
MHAAEAAVRAAMPDVRICAFGHLGDGNIHYNISQPVGADRQAFIGQWREVNAIVHRLVLSFGGSISAEHGIGQLKRDELAAIRPAIEIDLMRRIKHAFDPAGIMNPDKVIRTNLRFTLPGGAPLSHGKAELMELICETGSIRQAAQRMDMSYRRGWLLADELNRMFRQPVIETKHGGRSG